MDTRKKEIQKLSIWIGVFIAILIYIGFVFIENNYTSGFSTAFLFGLFSAIGSYVSIQNSIPKDYPISELKKKIIFSSLIFFGAWIVSTMILAEFLGLNYGFGGLLGFILAIWSAQYYAYGRQNQLKKIEKKAEAKLAAEEAKVAQEIEKKEREAQKLERRKVWLADLENDLA